MADSLSIWVPFLSAMGGGAITIVAQYLSDRRAENSEVKLKREERRERILLKRLEYQNDALLRHLEAVHQLTKATTEFASSGKAICDAAGNWMASPKRLDLYNTLKQALDEVNFSEKSVFNDTLVGLSQNYRRVCWDLVTHYKFNVDDPKMVAWINAEILLLNDIRNALKNLDRDILDHFEMIVQNDFCPTVKFGESIGFDNGFVEIK